MNEFYYCYSIKLQTFIKAKGFRYICAGLNENTMRKFWLYKRTDELHAVLDEWAKSKPD